MLDVILTVTIQTVILFVSAYFGYRILMRKMGETVEIMIDSVFTEPTVKGAMSVLGKKSAEKRADKAVVDDIAARVLDGPNMQGIKLVASAIGIDLDSMIENHGAVQTLMGLQQIGGMLGLDIQKLLASVNLGDLTKDLTTTSGGNKDSPYLKR